MYIQVNGEEREVSLNLSLHELIDHLHLAPERIAIELNQKVVRRTDWPVTRLQENDRVEIVHFVGGGTKIIADCQLPIDILGEATGFQKEVSASVGGRGSRQGKSTFRFLLITV